jgi:sugar phosphate isomerase/epimerase
LAAVRSIGFTEVELPNLLGKTPVALASMLRTAGLRCPSVHVPFDGKGLSLDDTERAGETLATIGARYAVVPIAPLRPVFAPGETWFHAMPREAVAIGVDGWRRIAEKLNDAAGRLSRHGVTTGYHNHDLELRRLPDGTTPFDQLSAATDPRHVVFEVDIGWVATAGVDPAAFLKRHASRIRLLHLKDTNGATSPDTAFNMTPAEPGRGIVDWRAVDRALRDVPIAHAFVEQEPPFIGPRIESARRGYAFFSMLDRLRRKEPSS